MYVRGGNAGVRTIRIRRVVALAAGLCLITLLAATVVAGVRYAGIRVDSDRMLGLERENEQLRVRLSSFEVDLDGLKGRMDSNFELQNRARLMASLDPLSEDVWQVGVGGPEPKLLERELSAADHVFTGLENDLDMLIRQTVLQKQSYDEIIGILEEEASMRDCTPSIRPLKGGFLSSRFGRRMDPFTGQTAMHRGLDFVARRGAPVRSTAAGTVKRAKRNGGYGLMVEIEHGDGIVTRYAHCSKLLVKRGQKVERGTIIALVGSTGRSTSSHVHYEVMRKGLHQDPMKFLLPSNEILD